jgi:RHS repeat-associated protein
MAALMSRAVVDGGRKLAKMTMRTLGRRQRISCCAVLVASLVSVIGPGVAWAQVQTFPPPVESDVTYYHTDAIGSVRLITRQDGSVAERYDYNPFGKALSPDVPAQSGDQPRGFAGKERDAGTGFDYFGGRYMLSDASRFTTVDPVLDIDSALTDPQRWNRYSYVSNRPLRRVDPDGRYEIDVHRYLTAVLSRAAGMSPMVASQIARADQGVDDSILTSPFWAPWNLDENHFTTDEVRQQMWQQFEQTGSAADLGVFLHAEQDRFSHAGYYPIPGHASDGHAPDKTFLRPDLANRMAESSFRHLQAAAARLNGKTIRVSWADIAGFVDRFNRAQTLDDKLEILNALMGFVESR